MSHIHPYDTCLFLQGAEDYLESPVIAITAVGNGGDPNHWRIFLTLTTQTSISMDMVVNTDSHNLTGLVGITFRRYAMTIHAVAMSVSHCGSGVTVRTVLETLRARGLLYYRYANPNAGCRWWVWNAMVGLEQQGLVAPGVSHELDTKINRHYSSFGDRGTRSPMEPGYFPLMG